MKVLVAGCDRPFGRVVADHLGQAHEVVAVGREGSDGVQEVRLSEPEEVRPLVAGMDAVVCADAFEMGVLEPVSDARTLDLLDDYPDDHVLEETFRPRPRPTPVSLATYLVEQTFREFAREGPIASICLRFGEIDQLEGTPGYLALEAIDRALTMSLEETRYRWFLYHVCESDRYPLRGAKQAPLSLKVED